MTDRRQDLDSVAPSQVSQSISSSLLERLQLREPDAWQRLVRIYYPLVRKWCEQAGLQPADAADVAQEVFRGLAGSLERFDRDGGRNSFRGWMYGITRRQLMAFRRRQREGPVAAGGTDAQRRISETPDAEYGDSTDEASCSTDAASERAGLVRRALALLREDVQEHTWQAFWRTVVEGQSPADIAADLGISVNTVYLSKARLLRKLREEFGELLE
jgi:RNA polymerase sigma-70 factor (ECF subfamily)